MDHIQQVKDRLSIEEVIGSYVQLRKAGRNFKACCPFHNEKTPSFVISPEKQIAHCFGCHWGGDVIKFVQDYEKMEFPEALETLASRAGIELPARGYSGANKSEKEQLKNIHRDAAQFFRKQLEISSEASEFVKHRGLSEKTAGEFEIGFCPDDFHATHQHLESCGYSKNELVRSGLVAQKNAASSDIFDRFRGRVIFPIRNATGVIVGFGGRVLADRSDTAKYINSPDTQIYSKGGQIYGFYQARDAIRESKSVIIVEGYFDVITAHQAGFRNVVASSGTALTETQLRLLRRHADEIIFCFDSDGAGENAALRSITLAQELDIPVKILEIPDGKDPDECIQKSVEIWEQAVKSCIPYMDFVIRKALEKHDRASLDGKKKIVSTVLASITRIANAVEREHYLRVLASETGTGIKALAEELSRASRPRIARPQAAAQEPSKPQYRPEELILALTLSHDFLREQYADQIDENWFDQPLEKSLYKNIIPHYNQAGLSVSLTPDEIQKVEILKLIGEEYYRTFSDVDREKELGNLIGRLQRKSQKIRIEELKIKLRGSADDPVTAEKLLNELNHIIKHSHGQKTAKVHSPAN